MTTKVLGRVGTPSAAPRHWSTTLDQIVTRVQGFAPTALRVSLALLFVWFGALKVVDASPVADLVAGTVPMAEADWFVPMLGGFEVALGLALFVGGHPLVIVALIGHLIGTFAVLVIRPEVAFQDGNFLALTTEGEFVVKNLVLIAAVCAIAGRSSGWFTRSTKEVAQ